MKIQVGLVRRSVVWEQLCMQEGVPCAMASLAQGRLNEDFSVLVVNRILTNAERGRVEAYVREGGAIIGYAHHLSDIPGLASRKERVDYIVSDHDLTFPDISILDLGVLGSIPREANALRTQANNFAMFAGPLGDGYAVSLPFDVEEIFCDVRVANKNFFAGVERLPAERVSLVSKGEVRYLLHKALEYLHHVRRMWYAHLWYFPSGSANIFAFRVDTDHSRREEVDTLYDIARRHECSLSWFLDVKSHEPWLRHFPSLVDQEFGVHCYEHQVFPTVDLNLKNILRAVREMQAVGLHPGGFAAPYGVWTHQLARALEQAGFDYSSEFSYAYDTLPLYPVATAGTYAVLQVPIHPVCIGSLLRVGYSDAQMMEYFKMVMDFKSQRCEPMIFYHHPIHRKWNVTEFIFDYAHQHPVQNITLGEYARWWKVRGKQTVNIDYDGGGITMKGGSPEGDIALSTFWVRATTPEGTFAIVPAQGRFDGKSSLKWHEQVPPIPPPPDVRRIREFDLRSMLGDLYTTLTRKS